MIKRIIIIFIFLIINLPIYAKNCYTGFACSINNIKSQEENFVENSNNNQNDLKNNIESNNDVDNLLKNMKKSNDNEYENLFIKYNILKQMY
ncbi:hypothetical protein IJG14_02940 [bacterium]|nr:hypothetical protein [bacterium]